MTSTPTSRELVVYDEEKTSQLCSLCLLSGALTETCKARNDISYASGDGGARDEPLGEVEKFLCKLALICDTQKGGKTMSALVCLRRSDGPEYLFTSNFRNESELEKIKKYLSGLLDYVLENPEDLEEKALHKQVLWCVLERNFNRVSFYLRALAQSVDECIAFLPGSEGAEDPGLAYNLDVLRKTVQFPIDMSSTEASRSRFLHDCEGLISISQDMRAKGFQKSLDERANDSHRDAKVSWRQLRHYLGRLQSYRQAADNIIAASIEMPELFENAKVSYIKSAKPSRIDLPTDKEVRDIAKLAFPDLDPEDYEEDIRELEDFGLNQNFREQLSEKRMKTMVHGEVHLHTHLVAEGKINREDYWDDTIFIATSKPLCKLCHFYFSDSEFRVQSSHLNLYPKWRLPDIYEDQGPEIQRDVKEHMEDVIEQLQEDIRKTFRNKTVDWRRNDSRTDSHEVGSGTRGMPSRAAYADQLQSHAAPESRIGGGAPSTDDRAPPTPPHGSEEDWDKLSKDYK